MAAILSDPSDFIPERVLDAPRRPSWPRRLRIGVADGLTSLLLNAAVVAIALRLGWPPLPAPAEPNTLSVDLIDHMPGAGGQAGEKGETGGQSGSADPQAKPGSPEPAAPAQPSAASSEPAAPTEVKPAQPSPAQPETATPAGLQQPTRASQQPAVPPALGHSEADPKPRLVEAPPDPNRAITQTKANTPANAATAQVGADEPPKPAPTPLRPQVLATAQASESLPPAAPKPETSSQAAEAEAEAKRQAETTAKLAAALPYSQTIGPDSLRAALSGTGAGTSAEYRGAVYGAFRKADAVIQQARERHLRGEAVIAFTIDDTGALADAHVALSSGNPAIDQVALAYIEQAAPYPPPPPGAQRSFAPTIALGVGQ